MDKTLATVVVVLIIVSAIVIVSIVRTFDYLF